jgi:RNA polymerase sigma factor (sigma-70 family)
MPAVFQVMRGRGALSDVAGAATSALTLRPRSAQSRPADPADQGKGGFRVADATDRARFAATFLPHLDDAYRLARWLTGRQADAEDVVQEAALRALKGIARFSGANPRAWVLVIVRNAAYTWLAKNRPSAVVLAGDLEETEQDHLATHPDQGMPTPEDVLIAKRDGEELHRRVAELPLAFREVLVLREIHDLEYREIAAMIDVRLAR